MRRLVAISMLLPVLLVAVAGAQETTDNCLTCHQAFEAEDGPSYRFERDVHHQKGLSCADCHGGDPSMEDMEEVYEAESWIGVPDHTEVPEFCARCHSDPNYMRNHNPSLPTDQLAKYKTSIHGTRLFEKGDTKVANCVSCHTSHVIADADLPYSSTHPQRLPFTCGNCHADEEYMAEYPIGTSQLEDYRQSVHGVALLDEGEDAAPACNDCHSNHGAAPPGVESLSSVCGVCHAIEAHLFEDSPHNEAFRALEYPMCETCHSNHLIKPPSDKMIALEEPGVCGQCHVEGGGTKAPETIDSMRAAISNLLQQTEVARTRLTEAQQKGMMTTDLEFVMQEVEQAIIKTRTKVHAFTVDSVGPQATEGIEKADSVQTQAASLVDEYYFRRKGLAVSTIIIAIVAVALFLKIRRMERG